MEFLQGANEETKNSVLLEETTRGSMCILDRICKTLQVAGFPSFENKARHKKAMESVGFRKECGAAKCQENQST